VGGASEASQFGRTLCFSSAGSQLKGRIKLTEPSLRKVSNIPVLAHDQLETAIAQMRLRFTAISEQIAAQLSALARSAAQSSPRNSDAAILSAAAQIGTLQERLCAEANRLPIGPQQRFSIMQTLLQSQHEALLHLGVLVRQHALAARGLTSNSFNTYMGPTGPDGTQSYETRARALAPIGVPSPPIRDARRAYSIDEALAEIRGTTWPSYDSGVGAPSAMEPSGRHSGGAGSTRAGRGAAGVLPRLRAIAVLKGVTSRFLGLTATAGMGLLIAYATFPQATPSDSDVKRLELPSSSVGRATPLPAPHNDTPAPMVQPQFPGPDAISPADSAATEPSATPSLSPMPVQQTTIDTPLPRVLPTPPMDKITNATASASAPALSAVIPREIAPAAPAPSSPIEAAGAEQFVPVLFTHKDQAITASAFTALQRDYPNVLKRRHSEVQSVEVNRNGIWHRLVVLPAGSRQQATQVCDQLKAAGYDRCWVKVY
jgi:SPOR domain